MSPFRLTLLLFSLGLAGCGVSAGERPAMVFAAASLTAPFQKLAAEFESLHPDSSVELHFAGTSRLVVQVFEGAPVDVFASADQANMQKIVDAGHVLSTPEVFARNRLAIAVAKGNPKGIRGLADLARTDLRVVLCGPEVPAGRYARQALAKAGVVVQPVSDEPSVKAVVSKVQLGEVDAGIVYVTDTARAGESVDAVDIPEQHNVMASYPIALLSCGDGRAAGEKFCGFVLSPEGQGILRAFGFSGP